MVSLSASGRAKEYAQVWFLHYFDKAEMDYLGVYSLRDFFLPLWMRITFLRRNSWCQGSLHSINLFFPKVRSLPLPYNQKVNEWSSLTVLSWQNVKLAHFSGYETPHNNKALSVPTHRASLQCPRRKTSNKWTIRGSHIVIEVWSLQAVESHTEMPCDMNQRRIWPHWKVMAAGIEEQKDRRQNTK